jgi:hypothetical protein
MAVGVANEQDPVSVRQQALDAGHSGSSQQPPHAEAEVSDAVPKPLEPNRQ